MISGRTFGQCLFETPAGRLDPESDIHFGLLLFVAADATGSVLRDELAALLWPGQDAESTRHRLRQALYRLRQLDVPIRLRSGRVVLTLDACTLDVRAILHGTPPRSELIRLGELPFLPSYAPRISDPFSHWVEELRRRVSGRLRRALSDEIAEAKSNARYSQVGQLSRALLTFDPLNEVATFGLVESMALEGSKVEAIRMLDAYEKEVGAVSGELRLPVRLLRHRVSECLNDSLLPRHFDVPFVGREKEFTELRALLRAAGGGKAQSAIVTGEAGIGKTRLANELLRVAALDGGTVATYTTSAGDTFTPLSTLISVSQILLSLPGALGCAEEKLSFVRRLGTPETVTAWSLSEIAADIAYAQMVSALAELVSAIADEAPLVLVVDDAHRLHQTTWRILMDILERVSNRRMLLLLAARQLPSWFGSLGAASCERLTRQLRLQPFGRAESLQYLEIWSGKNGVPINADEASMCATTSQGNPFYLGELAGHIGRGGDPAQAPSSIKELIELQHAALSKGAQRMLLAIALLGARGILLRLSAVLELVTVEFIAWLHELEDIGLVVSKSALVRCRHDLVADVSLAVSTPGVRSFLRVRIAELLEIEADATNSAELLGDAIVHWECAGDMKRAFDAAMKLGSRLLSLGMGEDSADAFRSASTYAEATSDRQRAVEGGIRAAWLSGNCERTIADLATRAQLTSSEDPAQADTTAYELIEAEATLFGPAHRWSPERLLQLAASSSTSELRLRAAALAAIFGDNDYDSDLINGAYSAVRDLNSSALGCDDAALLELVYHATIGDAQTVSSIAAEYARIVRVGSDKRVHILGLRRASNALRRVGLYQEAIPLLDEVLFLASRLRLPRQRFITFINLASVYLEAGDDTNVTIAIEAQRELSPICADPFLDLCLRHHEMTLAWLTQDGDAALSLLQSASAPVACTLSYARHVALSYNIGLRSLVAPASITKDEVRECHAFYLRGRAFGEQDQRTAMLLSAMSALGDSDGARRVCEEYLSIYRREITRPTERVFLTALTSGDEGLRSLAHYPLRRRGYHA